MQTTLAKKLKSTLEYMFILTQLSQCIKIKLACSLHNISYVLPYVWSAKIKAIMAAGV